MGSALEDQVVIVTGAGDGLGASHARLLGALGARVIVCDRGVDWHGAATGIAKAERTVSQIRASGGSAVPFEGDCADWDTARSMVQIAIDSFGRLDGLVLNAGIMRLGTVAAMSVDDWDDVIRVHLRGTFAPAHFACKHWRRVAERARPVAGRIVTTSSPAALCDGHAINSAAYAAAKAGIIGFTITLAGEMADTGVTANVVVPGAITHPDGHVPGGEAVTTRLVPERVSPVVAWLMSDASASVTGRVFNVMGGRIDRIEPPRLVDGAFKDAVWSLAEIGDVMAAVVGSEAPPTMADFLTQAMARVARGSS